MAASAGVSLQQTITTLLGEPRFPIDVPATILSRMKLEYHERPTLHLPRFPALSLVPYRKYEMPFTMRAHAAAARLLARTIEGIARARHPRHGHHF